MPAILLLAFAGWKRKAVKRRDGPKKRPSPRQNPEEKLKKISILPGLGAPPFPEADLRISGLLRNNFHLCAKG
jgi:hypothetical protein